VWVAAAFALIADYRSVIIRLWYGQEAAAISRTPHPAIGWSSSVIITAVSGAIVVLVEAPDSANVPVLGGVSAAAGGGYLVLTRLPSWTRAVRSRHR
jgi:hypothetical protein